MRLGLLVWAVVAVLAAPAGAVGYDDFSRGLTASLRGDNDIAISAFTAALAASDLPPAYKPMAYRGRSRAYLRNQRCKEALADADAAIGLSPSDMRLLTLRVSVKLCLKDFAGVQQDYDALMGKTPSADMYFEVGRLLWDADGFAPASESFLKALELVPKKDNASAKYDALWYAITMDRLGHFDAAKFAGYIAEMNNSTWPSPLLNLYLGKLKLEQVPHLEDHTQVAGQTCEFNFYSAEWQIARGNSDAAKPLITEALAKCPKGFVEYQAAVVEARRLGLPPAKEETP